MNTFQHDDSTVSVQAAAAVLAHLDAAQLASTYLHHGAPFALIEECRLAVAERLRVEVERFIDDDEEEGGA